LPFQPTEQTKQQAKQQTKQQILRMKRMDVLNESRAPQAPTREVKNVHPSHTFFQNHKTTKK